MSPGQRLAGGHYDVQACTGPWTMLSLDLGQELMFAEMPLSVACAVHLAGKAHVLAEGTGAYERDRLAGPESA